jgi:hypothetical protein
MDKKKYTWDFFIAHSSADKDLAEKLYGMLASKARVFLDSRSLILGDDWDDKIKEAQLNSLVTLVLISSSTEKAYYQKEEIAAAIALARKNPENHRVVPIYLNKGLLESNAVPYGLRLKHGLTITETFSLSALADKLILLMRQLKKDKSLSMLAIDDKKHTYESEKFTISEKGIKGILALAAIGILGTILFSIFPEPNPNSLLHSTGVVTLAKMVVVCSGPVKLDSPERVVKDKECSKWRSESITPRSSKLA